MASDMTDEITTNPKCRVKILPRITSWAKNIPASGALNVAEIPPGGALEPEKHLYDELLYIWQGRGLSEVWHEGQGIPWLWLPLEMGRTQWYLSTYELRQLAAFCLDRVRGDDNPRPRYSAGHDSQRFLRDPIFRQLGPDEFIEANPDFEPFP